MIHLENNLIFSLDIGTRTIIGLVGQYTENDIFKVIAYSKREHKKRNMYDGQIHDIEGVAITVKEIVEDLEVKLKEKLKIVSIAAAGRSLRTHKIKIEKEIDETAEITRRQIEALELEAVQKSERELNEREIGKDKDLKYYNIGYTINSYYLEGDKIESLLGHKASKIGVELLSTFLPQVVIESLYSVISKVGLEIGSITLEPIAAINVAIKRELRLLNLALVDIGAGTSDIAITKDGEITAYGMTQIAGDEITERLSREYLLDFKSSEKLKIELSEKEEHEFIDIVGVTYELNTSEIVDSIIDIIDKIAEEITREIFEYNNAPPDAVFLVGGSSKMPMIREKIAENLGLPKERVSIRDTSFIDNIEGLDELTGPDMITPIGIAIEAVDNKYKNFLKIIFKGEEVRIFNTDNIKVSDVLILTGYNPRNLIPKSAEDFIYFINGKRRKITGEPGINPEIVVNEKVGSLKTPLSDGDVIDIKEYKTKDIELPSLYSVVDMQKNIIYNNETYNLVKSIKINDNIVNNDVVLKRNDEIILEQIKTVEDFLDYYKIKCDRCEFFVNDLKVNRSYNFKKGDYLEIVEDKEEILDEKLEVKGRKTIKLLVNNEEMEIIYKKDKFLFVDIFDHIDFDLSKLRGKLVLMVNGDDAEYLKELSDGDSIQIYWE